MNIEEMKQNIFVTCLTNFKYLELTSKCIKTENEKRHNPLYQKELGEFKGVYNLIINLGLEEEYLKWKEDFESFTHKPVK